MRRFFTFFAAAFVLVMFAGCVAMIAQVARHLPHEEALNEPSILQMKLEGIIMDSSEFVDDLREYAKNENIKGVLISVNSPGGVVGPSEEIYREIKRVRDDLKKPVVVSFNGLAASGAFYASMGATKIYSNAGSLVGSIGVIMEFANLEKLYEWAKIKRFVISTGAYKDSGAEYREMRPDERAVFQKLANEVLDQFKAAVAEGRKLKPEQVTSIADGRVFTGLGAKELGLVDEIGSYTDAIHAVGELTGLGPDPKLYDPPSPNPTLAEIIGQVKTNVSLGSEVSHLKNAIMHSQYWGQPLFLMPGAVGP